jgi:DNA-binding CsgD family transcriptional regulator
VDEPGVLASALGALGVGDVAGARATLAELCAGEASAVARQLYAQALLLDDELDDCRRQLELAFRAWRDVDPGRAGLCAAQLAELHISGLGNRAAGQGWLQRARRVLEPLGRCPEEGHVALAVVACESDDVTALERAADRALELATEFGDHELEVRALADGGYALVVQGREAEGFARLDEAMAALSAGEVVDPAVLGKSFCALLSACDRGGDVRRAEEWTRVVTDAVLVPLGGRPRLLHAHCRLAYGSVLCTSGRWEEGERALLEAMRSSAYFVHRSDAAARLASVRLRQGRIDEAAELLAPYEDRPRSAEPLARLHLLAGRPELARVVARRGLGAVPGDLLAEASLRAVLVEVELACLDVEAAAGHAEALAALAAAVQAPVVHAEAALARGRVSAARLDPDAAVAALDEAWRALGADHLPLLAGSIALELAQVLAERGDQAGAVVQGRIALTTLEELGAVGPADRARALLRTLGAPGRRGTRRPDRAVAELTGREQEVLALLREGLTNAEIGDRLFISTKTAEHHVGRVLAKLGVRSRAEAAAVATAASLGGDGRAGPGGALGGGAASRDGDGNRGPGGGPDGGSDGGHPR